ncbi:LysR substrate-binding domain-containing protein [Xanthomonas nasturtii]|uniref:LysR substrate-binding domain-containing protein n=1 Tax=Xanthomonas nasturtii TaxID=1843581 RepID=UPI0020130F10|nr:LysR substrate-binding domain-containing protein [Xanthomonas nasturtii]MCL1503219.1 LysR substrate-binding domain-containing protein [Xanthomonas nasturtii]
MSRPPLHALQGFVSAVRLGNLSRAATAMHLTVSALSHQMRALAQRLGCPLLQRHARGVTATLQGQQLLDRAPHLDAIAEAFEPFGARREDTLTLSITPSMASAWLVPRLGEFLAVHPTIEINLLSSERLVDFERQQQVDAAMRIGAGQWGGVIAEPLFDEWLAPMASPALIARMGGVEAPPLHHWPLLGDPDDAGLRWFAAFGGDAPRRYVAVLDESEAHHRAALDGVGVALGRVTRARLLLASGQLVALSTQRLKTSWSHYLLYPPRSSTHGGFLAFRAWLQAQAREHAAHAQQATTTPPAARRRKRTRTLPP